MQSLPGTLELPFTLTPESVATHQPPADGRHFTLDEMQSAVGGYVEMVVLRDGTIMLCNEEGRLQNLPVNRAASYLAERIIVGTVIVANADNLE
jgi:alpha-acetolactate decarboxylase